MNAWEEYPFAALHASAPEGHSCADCFMDKEPCPACYTVFWNKRHPNTVLIESARPEVEATKYLEDVAACIGKSVIVQRELLEDILNHPSGMQMHLSIKSEGHKALDGVLRKLLEPHSSADK